jgi:hypothetical protein
VRTYPKYLCALLLLTGCATKPVQIERPVTVEIPIVIRLPEVLLEPFPRPQAPEGPLTCADVIELAPEWRRLPDQCNARLEAIRRFEGE